MCVCSEEGMGWWVCNCSEKGGRMVRCWSAVGRCAALHVHVSPPDVARLTPLLALRGVSPQVERGSNYIALHLRER